MRISGLGRIALVGALTSLAAVWAEERATEETLKTRPPTKIYQIQDERGRRLTLSRWDIGKEQFLILKDSVTGDALEKMVTEGVEQTLAVYKVEQYKVMVSPEKVNDKGENVPAVFETRLRQVLVTPENVKFMRDGKAVAEITDQGVTIGAKKFSIANELAAVSPENLIDNDPAAGFALASVVKQKPTDIFAVTAARGQKQTLFVWNVEAKWYFVLAEGQNVKKKVAALRRNTVPAVYETRTRKVCVVPEQLTALGETIPAVYKDEEYKVLVRPSSFAFSGLQDDVEIVPGVLIRVGAESFSLKANPAPAAAGTGKAVLPPKAPKDDDF